MTHKQIHLGQQLRQTSNIEIGGQYVSIEGETYYQIKNYDQMKDFFISVVSDSDHWSLYPLVAGFLLVGLIQKMHFFHTTQMTR